MHRFNTLALVTIFSFSTSIFLNAEPRLLDNWHQWRGPFATGFTPKAKPPLKWNEEENIKWKTVLPGSGHSTPIVWEDTIYLTATIPEGEKLPPPPPQPPGAHNNKDAQKKHRFLVIAIDRSSGKIRWNTTVRFARPLGSTHETGTWASASPITDGKRVYAFFGSNGLYCISLDGKVLWEKEFGPLEKKHGHGEGTSPALHENTLIINCDHEGESYILAIESGTGKELWKKERDEPTSWATPVIAHPNTHPQVIVLGTRAIRSYDLKTGEVLWSCRGLSHNVVASPVFEQGILYAGSSYDTRAVLAINTVGARGDITATDHVLWRATHRPPYVPSPLLVKNRLYYLRHYQNILTQREALTGKVPHPPIRLPGLLNIYASPVAADGKIYISDQQGATLVLDQKTTKPIHLNRIDESINASLAISLNQIFIRGSKHLYCIE